MRSKAHDLASWNSREQKTFSRMFIAVWVASIVSSLAVLGFGIWVVVAVLKHFGIV